MKPALVALLALPAILVAGAPAAAPAELPVRIKAYVIADVFPLGSRQL
jgi:hypothetical protein